MAYLKNNDKSSFPYFDPRYELSIALNFSNGFSLFDKITVNGLFSFNKSMISVEFMRSKTALFLSIIESPIFNSCVNKKCMIT